MTHEIFITAHPRSGQTWLGRMLGDLLHAPLQAYNDPVIITDFSREIEDKYLIRKTHTTVWDAHYPELRQRGTLIFTQRDPRDVMISAFYFRALGDKPNREELLTKLIRGFVDRRAKNVPHVFHEMGVYEQWIRGYVDSPDSADVFTSFEALKVRGVSELIRVAEEATGESIDREEAELVYARQSIEQVKRWGPEKWTHHSVRKGVVGDWQRHFNREHCKEIDKHLGQLMMEQGYITNRDWWKDVDESAGE